MSKKNILVISSFIVTLIAVLVLVAYSKSGSKEANPQLPQGNLQQKQESLDPYFKRFNSYLRDGKYEEAIAEAKKMIEVASADERGYNALQSVYSMTGRYAEALAVSEKVIAIARKKGSRACGSIETHAMILEYAGRQDEAIKFLENYRQDCPETVERDINGLKEAKSKKGRFFPH